jgi:NADH:ubiquinone oxidoreductase subunit B-like Fe-S oxidoreductase
MGSLCAICGGLFQLAYSVWRRRRQGDSGRRLRASLPAAPESLTEGLLKLQEKIQQEKWLVRRDAEPARGLS